MLSKEEKTTIVKNYGVKFGNGEKDTGSTAVQVALLSARIKNLSEHLIKNKHDYQTVKILQL